MSAPKVRSSRLPRIAIILMIVLGVFTILVSVAVAAIIIVLAGAMYLAEWWLVRKVRRAAEESA